MVNLMFKLLDNDNDTDNNDDDDDDDDDNNDNKHDHISTKVCYGITRTYSNSYYFFPLLFSFVIIFN